MDVQLTDDQKAFVRQAIQDGRLAHEGEAVQEALSLWEQRERRRAEILSAVDHAEASYSRGEGCLVTNHQSAVELAERIKTRGRARLDQ